VKKSINQIILTAGLLFSGILAHGQESPDTLQLNPEPVIVHEDDTQIIISDVLLFDDSDTLSGYAQHSPAKATIMSAVVPGLGQIYNKKVWKVPLVYAALGASAYYFLKYQNNFQKYRRAYIDYNDGDPHTNYHENRKALDIPLNYTGDIGRVVTNGKDVYRRYRDWAIIAVVAAYGLNLIDANVDAHLMNYNIDDNISLNIKPCFLANSMYSQKIGLTLCFTF
jgi:hypothetical protein